MDVDEFEELILPIEFNHTSIRALGPSTRKKIAQFLDLEGALIVVGEQDLVNNYNGLAELIGFAYLEIRNIGNQKSPTEELLDKWTVKERCENATVGNLWGFLYQLERFDVLKDCRRNILNDSRKYEEYIVYEREAERYRMEKQMEQDPKVTNSEMKVDELKFVSVDDVRNGKMTRYDAFVCYESDGENDLKFVREMIQKLEVERDLKLFVPGRDDLPGSAEHNITAYLIEKRCKRIVILMSKAFLNSTVCDFQTKFAHALAPGARSKKLIPVITEKKVPLPRILKFLAVCDFTKSDMQDWVWDRLYSAIIAPIPMNTDQEFESEGSSLEDLRSINFPISHIRRLDTPDTSSKDSGYGDSSRSSISASTPPRFTESCVPTDNIPDNQDNQCNKHATPSLPSKPKSKEKNEKPKKYFFGIFGGKNKEDKSKKKVHSDVQSRNPNMADTRDYPSMRQQRYRDANQGTNEMNTNYERSEDSPHAKKGPMEHVDSTRRVSFESLSTSPYGGSISMQSISSRDSAECNEVTSSTGVLE